MRKAGRSADPGTLRRQLVALTALLSTLVGLALVGVVGVVLERSSSTAVDRVLSDRAAAVVAAADRSASPTPEVPDENLDPGVAVYDARGVLVGGQVPPSLETAFARLAGTDRATASEVGEDYQVLAEPFRTSAGADGTVVLAEPLAPYEGDVRTALLVAAAAGAVIVLLATGLVAWASRRALEPVAAMARTAEQWSERDLERRFGLGEPTTEIRALGHTLDGLLDKVAGAIQAEQRLTSELAHELRTPLTAVQATAELVALRDDLDDQLRADLHDILTSCHAMAATITGLLDLARGSSAGGDEHTCSVRDAVEALRRRHAAGDRVRNDLAPELVAAAEPALVERALAPVVDNAVRHASHVTVSGERRDRLLVLRVGDDGPGVAPGLREHLFEPGSSTTGSGLGLALARRVARSVGGDVVLLDAPGPGAAGAGGAVFEVTLPARPGAGEAG